jgi:hypothetical protein
LAVLTLSVFKSSQAISEILDLQGEDGDNITNVGSWIQASRFIYSGNRNQPLDETGTTEEIFLFPLITYG